MRSGRLSSTTAPSSLIRHLRWPGQAWARNIQIFLISDPILSKTICSEHATLFSKPCVFIHVSRPPTEAWRTCTCVTTETVLQHKPNYNARVNWNREAQGYNLRSTR